MQTKKKWTFTRSRTQLGRTACVLLENKGDDHLRVVTQNKTQRTQPPLDKSDPPLMKIINSIVSSHTHTRTPLDHTFHALKSFK